MPARAWWPVALLAACSPASPVAVVPPTVPPGPTDPAADCLDYATVGAPTLTTWCTACHASALVGEARHGAPDGVDLDTLAGARLWAERVNARAIVARDMPYGGGIPEAERARFQRWLECGLPGDEVAWPAAAAADPPDTISERRAEVVDDDGDLLLVVTWGGVEREALRFRAAGDQAFWVEEVHTDADGDPSWSRTFEPPLRVWGDPGEWTEQVTAIREEGGVVRETSETWTVRRGPAGAVDARVRDQDAEEVVLTSSTGETYTWLFSPETSFAERRRADATGEDVAIGLTAPPSAIIEGFPVEAGRGWGERGYTRSFE